MTPVRIEEKEQTLSTIPPVMDTIVQQTFVSPAKVDLHRLDEETPQTPVPAQVPAPSTIQSTTLTTTEQLAEQTAHTLDEIRK